MTPTACAGQMMRTLGSAERCSFAVEDSATGSPVGNVGVTVRPHSVELSYWITAPARGHGFAAAALSAAANWAEETFDRPVLELQTHPDNVASQSVALRAGFVARGRRMALDDCADADGMVAHFERVKGPGGGDGSLGEAGRG